MTGKLLPCPFCGTRPKLKTCRTYDPVFDACKLYWFVCQLDGCGVGVEKGAWSKRDAAARWNRRAATPLQSAAESLLEAVDVMQPTLPGEVKDAIGFLRDELEKLKK